MGNVPVYGANFRGWFETLAMTAVTSIVIGGASVFHGIDYWCRILRLDTARPSSRCESYLCDASGALRRYLWVRRLGIRGRGWQRQSTENNIAAVP